MNDDEKSRERARLAKEMNDSVVMAVSHRPSMNLRFVKRDGRYILQQMFLPNDWTTHEEEWRDVPLVELAEAPLDIRK